MPRPDGSLGDKDSEGNIPPVDMEPIHTPVANLSGTGAKYRVDETQSTRLRYQSLTKNKGKTSSEVVLDTEPLQLQTFAAIQAFILFEDELDKDSDKEEVLATGEDMDEDPQDAKEVDTPPPKQLIKYLRKMLRVLFSKITENQWEQHKEAITDKLIEASMSSLEKSSTTISDLYKGLDVITQLLKDINNAIKDDPTTNKKIDETIKNFSKISTQTTEILSLAALKHEVSSLRRDTSEIKSMLAEIYLAFKGQSSSAPLGSVTPTLALTHIPTNVDGENATNTITKEPTSHTKGKTEDLKIAIPISSIQPTEVQPTQALLGFNVILILFILVLLS
nr:hypothetical protein [Tanacetum cinerariifolium]